MRLLFLFGILILNIAALAAQQSSNIEISNATYAATNWTRDRAVRRLARGANHFANNLVREVAKDHRNNLIISPLGVSLILSLTSFGAGKETNNLLQNALGLSSSIPLRKIGFQAVIDQLNSHKAAELRVANGVFLSSDVSPKRAFIESTVRAFRSSVEKVDFVQSHQASQRINEWCEIKTNNRIKNIVSPDDLSEDTALVLVNALYFKGTWMNKFNAEDTMELPFMMDNGTVKQLPTMSAINDVRYGEYPGLNAEFIELPYVSEDPAHKMSMFVILPKNLNGLASLEENIGKVNIETLLNVGTHQQVDIQLPKFKIESEIRLEEPLSRMGLGDLFNSYKADFSGLIETGDNNQLNSINGNYVDRRDSSLVIDKIVQKAFIEVNEEGSEAAAATAAVFGFRSGFSEYPSFHANHPFYFILATTGKHRLNVFTGRFTG